MWYKFSILPLDNCLIVFACYFQNVGYLYSLFSFFGSIYFINLYVFMLIVVYAESAAINYFLITNENILQCFLVNP